MMFSECDSPLCVPKDGWEQKECNKLRDLNYVTQFDSRIDFDEKRHVYFLDNELLQGSSTGFIHSFFGEFDADKAIELMRNGRKWGPGHANWGQSNKEIKLAWEKNKNEAAECGTRMHELIEWFYNDLVSEPQLRHFASEHGMPELLQFLEYHNVVIMNSLRTVPLGYDTFNAEDFILTPFRTELRVFYEPPAPWRNKTLAGSVDMLYYECSALARSDLDLVLCDWKRSKEIKMESFKHRDKGIGPCAHLDDCNFNHYSLQLNLYQWMIQQKTKYRITRRFICVFHPNQTSYQMLPVADMQDTIFEMIEQRIK
jgi:hypothetical protein